MSILNGLREISTEAVLQYMVPTAMKSWIQIHKLVEARCSRTKRGRGLLREVRLILLVILKTPGVGSQYICDCGSGEAEFEEHFIVTHLPKSIRQER